MWQGEPTRSWSRLPGRRVASYLSGFTAWRQGRWDEPRFVCSAFGDLPGGVCAAAGPPVTDRVGRLSPVGL